MNQMAMRNETIRHFDLTLQGKDGHPLTVDVSILNFVVRQPGIFYLAHILKPSRRVEPTRPMVEAGEEPPRSALASVRSSPDSRAHRLTAREVEVLGMLAAGHPTAEIGCGCTSQF